MNKIQCLLILTISFLWLAVSPQPASARPDISSQYYCVIDQDTGQPILSKNASNMRPVASTTKMMTGILAVEYASLKETAIVSQNADHTPEYTIGLKTGQEIRMDELLKAALIRSSNDAAVVIAEHVAGDQAVFAWLMSKKAFAIGAMHTRFKNASGLPAKDHYSTAFDLAQIGRYALSKPDVKKLVGSPQVSFKHPGYREPLTLRNTNSLLESYPGANGIKTGTADASGKCLVASASRNGRNLIAVVLRSGDRNGDCIRLFNYAFNQSSLQKIIEKNADFKSIKLENGEQSFAEIGPAEDIYIWMGNDKPDIQKRVRMDYDLHAPIQKNQKVGHLDIFVEGQYLRSTDLLCLEGVRQEAGMIGKSWSHFFKIKGKEPIIQK